MRYEKVQMAVFLERPNRFIARCRMFDGSIQESHVPNTGRCRELLVPGCRVFLQFHDNPARKTRHSLIAVDKDGLLINMDSQAPNRVVEEALLERLSGYCDEFLIHAVDVEGKSRGIEEELALFLGNWGGKAMTYAGGVHSYEDLELLKKLGKNRLNVTIGSALDLFGGTLSWKKVSEMCKKD